MAKPRKGKKNDDRERAKTSREKRKEDLGAPFTINMHDKNKKDWEKYVFILVMTEWWKEKKAQEEFSAK
nr:hypothetical protein [Providencia rettgeri]